MEPFVIPGSGGALRIRDLTPTDIPFIATYWETSPPEHLERMGVNRALLPDRAGWEKSLASILATPDASKTTCVLVWEVEGEPIGFTSLKRIRFGQEGEIHLHMWRETARGKGHGTLLFGHSLHLFLDRFQLARIICEPASSNPAPHRLFRRLGVPIARTYRTVASELCFDAEVHRYEMDRAKLAEIRGRLAGE